MSENRSIVGVIDAEHDRNRMCRTCGAPTVVRSEDDETVVVACSAADGHTGVMARLIAALVPHDRITIRL